MLNIIYSNEIYSGGKPLSEKKNVLSELGMKDK